jgi:pimeloyl-ACP methyl ester carboxylesterase
MIVRWQKWNGVEAQSFEPERGASDAILFCPGFPGMGGTVFEQRHAAALAELGFAVIVIKHKGTKLSGALAPVMVNNGARLMAGRKAGETHIGGGAATIDEWLDEPFHVLNQISKNYGQIHVIGNSFGALSALHSVTRAGAPLENVSSILLYAGAQGMDDGTEDGIMRLWKPEYMMATRITEKVTLNDPFDIEKTLAGVYRDLPLKVRGLPAEIKISALVVAQDELLRRADSDAFNAAIGGRMKIVMDSVDHAWPAHGLLAHDTPNYTTEDLIKLIEGQQK